VLCGLVNPLCPGVGMRCHEGKTDEACEKVSCRPVFFRAMNQPLPV
jgi:hypothetical protein